MYNKIETDQYYDNIYNQLKTIAEKFEIAYIPLNTLKMVLKDNRINKAKQSHLSAFKAINKLNDTLYQTCEKYCLNSAFGSKIPLYILKNYIDIIKISIYTGINE